ncbi:ADP-ribosylglycohydrolase family protein [Streptomyces lavendulae]|uniref:ADP-ribosylglycohydrolase family protein n=1 Tax=Streptomyces lavendulae TaxID=1914 RepID=UPI0024A3BE00|nr:ADP-ribosylglycohydrolase family protein [Streptomyces lavendulae]GLX22607.1 ribosylglycohydrolase [Streptomyces lavendulae subsp. lavendulae]GLX30090.1 ribosylglycohydrolase [Streptomyces lavendulae subsp. lavendulae]
MQSKLIDIETASLTGTAHPLSAPATDRAAGVLLGAACGDALGVPYEFSRRLRADERPAMIGGGLGPYEPGEYSDDTQMHVCIAAVASTGADLTSPSALDQIARNFHQWRDGGASDIGNQTRSVLGAAKRHKAGTPAQAMLAEADAYTARTEFSAGNGSLMRTGIVALAYLDDVDGMVRAATLISSLTHSDPECIEACILWCSGIRTAVLDATFDGVREGITLLPDHRQEIWHARLDEAEENPPHHWARNGYVVTALQAAWSAITRTPIPELAPERGSFPAQHFQLATEAAVRAGNDTDTVAAIAGALLGARWGVSAIPLAWQQAVNGWPTMRGAELVRLAVLTARKGLDDADGWPSVPRVKIPAYAGKAFTAYHPADSGVRLGNLPLTEYVGQPPVDAVVSLCRFGQAPAFPQIDAEHVRVWLIDKEGENPNLHYVVDQAARQVLRLRQEGKRVLLHCVAGRSRTPAIAAAYSTLLGTNPRTALEEVHTALGGHWTLPSHPQLHDAVYELAGQTPPATRPRPARRSFFRRRR